MLISESLGNVLAEMTEYRVSFSVFNLNHSQMLAVSVDLELNQTFIRPIYQVDKAIKIFAVLHYDYLTLLLTSPKYSNRLISLDERTSLGLCCLSLFLASANIPQFRYSSMTKIISGL
jgi:hypothetical protein